MPSSASVRSFWAWSRTGTAYSGTRYQTVRANVEEYRSAARGLRFVTRIGPIGGWILGPILLLVGLTLLATGRRPAEEQVAWAEEETRYQPV